MKIPDNDQVTQLNVSAKRFYSWLLLESSLSKYNVRLNKQYMHTQKAITGDTEPTKSISSERDSNTRPQDLQSHALPSELSEEYMNNLERNFHENVGPGAVSFSFADRFPIWPTQISILRSHKNIKNTTHKQKRTRAPNNNTSIVISNNFIDDGISPTN